MDKLIEPLDSHASETVADEGELLATEPVQTAWREIANWSTFFSVLLFITGSLLAITLVIAVSNGLRNPSLFFPMLFFVALVGLPAWWLLRFAIQTKRGLFFGESHYFVSSFDNLMQVYRFFGISSAVYLVILGLKVLASIFNYY